MKEPGSTVMGYFPKQFDYVKIYVFDVFEAEFFLQTGQLPVGLVKGGIPEHDIAEVEVIGLVCTEVVRVANIHIALIGEDEYEERANRILEAREEAVRQVDSALHERRPTVVWKRVMTISGERCLASALDKTTSLVIRVYDPRTKKRMECDASWDVVSSLTDVVLDDGVYFGDLETEEKQVREWAGRRRPGQCISFAVCFTTPSTNATLPHRRFSAKSFRASSSLPTVP